MIGRRPREQCVSFPLFGRKNTLQGRKEHNAKRVWRELSREVLVVAINKTMTVLGKDAHSSVLHTIGQRKVVVANVR